MGFNDESGETRDKLGGGSYGENVYAAEILIRALNKLTEKRSRHTSNHPAASVAV